MSKSNKDVKTNLLSHSEAKVKLLGDYLYKYLSIIANDKYTNYIRLFDLFCGQGKYENEGDGSPLVILRKLNEFYQSENNKMPTIDCYFNDFSIDKIEILKSAISNDNCYENSLGKTRFFSDDYLEIIETLPSQLPKLKGEKSFLFIDPYGYREIKASHIKSLMQHKNAEILLWLPTQHMYRFSENGTPESLHAFIEELTLYNEWKPTDNVWKFINQIKNGFRDHLGDEFYVDTFTIQKDPQTVFCLFFFTSHIKGYEKMLETKWNIDTEYGKGWEYSGNTPGLFFEHKTNKLEEKLKDFLRTEAKTNGQVYEFTLKEEYLPKHTNEIFKDWQNNGMISVITKDGIDARKKSFYVNYENYFNQPDRVKIKLK